jgi:hypothetical protein
MNAALQKNGLWGGSDLIEKEEQGDQEEGEAPHQARASIA